MSALTLLLEHAAEVARTHGSDVELQQELDEVHACEEALRLGLSFDEKEEQALAAQLCADEDEAATMTEEEEWAVAAVDAQLTTLCQKDEALARKLADELAKEEDKVQKLEARGRKLASSKLCKADYDAATQLAAEIEAEEREIQAREKRDRQLARKLVREVSKGIMNADEETKQLSTQINGARPLASHARPARQYTPPARSPARQPVQRPSCRAAEPHAGRSRLIRCRLRRDRRQGSEALDADAAAGAHGQPSPQHDRHHQSGGGRRQLIAAK